MAHIVSACGKVLGPQRIKSIYRLLKSKMHCLEKRRMETLKVLVPLHIHTWCLSVTLFTLACSVFELCWHCLNILNVCPQPVCPFVLCPCCGLRDSILHHHPCCTCFILMMAFCYRLFGQSQDHSGALMAEEFKACLISLGYDVENDKQVGAVGQSMKGPEQERHLIDRAQIIIFLKKDLTSLCKDSFSAW